VEESEKETKQLVCRRTSMALQWLIWKFLQWLTVVITHTCYLLPCLSIRERNYKFIQNQHSFHHFYCYNTTEPILL